MKLHIAPLSGVTLAGLIAVNAWLVTSILGLGENEVRYLPWWCTRRTGCRTVHTIRLR
jgi:hypothetical protein